MILKVILKTVVVFQFVIRTSFAIKYDIVLRDEEIFTPCDNPDFHFLSDYIDISDIKFETLANSSIYAKGDLVFVRDLGKANNPATIQSFKRQRNSWVSTIYNIEREDACTYIFQPKEIWSSVLDSVSQEYRKCPFYKGQKIHFDVVADLSLYVPNPQFAGEYKVQITVEATELNETFCTNMFMDIYRA